MGRDLLGLRFCCKYSTTKIIHTEIWELSTLLEGPSLSSPLESRQFGLTVKLPEHAGLVLLRKVFICWTGMPHYF
jgi:hypothetical protein